MRLPFTGKTGADRSITLLHVFLIASGASLLAGAVVLSMLLGAAAHDQALADERTSMERLADAVLGEPERRRDDLLSNPLVVEGLRQALARKNGIERVSVIRGPLTPAIELAKNQTTYDAHVWSADGSRIVGAYRLYSNPVDTASVVADRKRTIWLTVLGIFGALFVALAALVRGASAAMRRRGLALHRQSHALLEAYRQLERSSLEAIEGLNATIDARDPYTAGHSQRVQAISLAIAHQLGLRGERLSALRYGALFHDIGKIGVPDHILLKPGQLTPEEYAVIKRHVLDGAGIVGRFTPLQPAVPIVLHHHERFEGGGYPDGIGGAEIPIEAAVVGLADAWDAMTSDRPYRQAMDVGGALLEVTSGRGTQFHPDVVDALLVAIELEPELFAPVSLTFQPARDDARDDPSEEHVLSGSAA
jgi:putative nucleotidyltransferase with HDIG domain